jgi:hypothetical protein
MELKHKYETKEIPTVGRLLLGYVKFWFITVILSSLWNLIWWMPSFLMDYFVGDRLDGNLLEFG